MVPACNGQTDGRTDEAAPPVLKSCSIDGGDKTRNLAIVNRSRVRSAHTVTTVGPKCSGEGNFSRRESIWDTGGGSRYRKHKSQYGLVFHASTFSGRGTTCDTLGGGRLVADAAAASINFRGYSFFTGGYLLYMPPVFDAPVWGTLEVSQRCLVLAKLA